ncbi:MAG: hypothetical protein OEW39_17025, partial [Deltaproteobacteria bacterium]|nr:hypothetical protein [Deltaproteobacteria bacterium]
MTFQDHLAMCIATAPLNTGAVRPETSTTPGLLAQAEAVRDIVDLSALARLPWGAGRIARTPMRVA